MEIVAAVAPLRERVATLPRPVGFVPTMGALHAGHERLVRAAKAECAAVVVSVFVNPMQFGAGEDFARYPRDDDGDHERLAAQGADIVFTPSADAMYPSDFSTVVDVGSVGAAFEGAVRQLHFRGVATIVTKLLNAVQPDVLYLGRKDAQQTAVLRKLVRDLNVPVRLEVVATQREPDGLALSSRNAYLSQPERAAAPSLFQALEAMLRELNEGRSVSAARARASAVLSPLAQLEYLDAVDADTFEPLQRLRAPAFIVGAARFGSTRLIDNLMVAE